MLAAEFGYNLPYCDRYLDLDSIISHIEYHQKNPPAGTILYNLIESFFGDKKEDASDISYTSSFTQEVKDKIEGMSMDDKFKYLSTLPLTEKQKESSCFGLEGFQKAFTAVGGAMK